MVGIRRLRFVLVLAALLAVVGCQTVDKSSDPRRWGQPEKIESLTPGALRADVAIDPTGNAMAVWDQTDPSILPPDTGFEGSDDIWLSREDDTGRWGGAELLEQTEPDDSVFPQIGIDGDGTAFVAFLQSAGPEGDGKPYRVWAVRYSPSEDFDDEARCIQSTTDDPDCSGLDLVGDAGPPPQIAVDSKGNAVVMWQQGGAQDESTRVWFNRFAADSGRWLDAKDVNRNDTSDLLKPAVAMDGEGSAILVWEQLVDREVDRSSIWSRRQPRAGVLEDPQPLEAGTGNAIEPRVAADLQGNAIAVWLQQEASDSPFLVYANRYVASRGTWNGAELIGAKGADEAEQPQVAMDGDGNALAVWVHAGAVAAGVWSNRYLVDAGWDTAARRIGPRDLGPARSPQVAANSAGDAVAVWIQFDGVRDRVWSNRYNLREGWATSEAVAEPIETNDGRAAGPRVAVDPDGNAVSIWTQSLEAGGATPDLWTSRLAVPATR